MSQPGRLRRALASAGRFVGRRPGAVLLVMLALTAACAPFALRTVSSERLEKNLLEVLTRGMPRAEAYKRIGRDFGITERHFVLLECEADEDLAAAKEFADRLAAELASRPEIIPIARARYDLRKFFSEHAYLHLDGELYGALAGRFSDEGLARAMRANREKLRTSTALGEAVRRDPLNLADLLPRIAERYGGSDARFEADGYLVSMDGKALLVNAQPARSSADQEGCREVMAHTRESIARARAGFFTGGRAELAGRIRAEVGGAYATTLHVSEVIEKGIVTSALTSFIGILLLFALAYRRPAALFFIGVPLAVPVIWTLALAPLFLWRYDGRLSIVGATFGAVLLGLGIDYAIHIYNRYASERAAGRSPEEASEVGVSATGEGIVLGAMTTVVAFAGMTLTGFRGFKEFGTMAALGVFLTMLALLAGLPAALSLLSKMRGGRERAPRPLSFGLAGALRAVKARPGLLLGAGFLMLAGSTAAMFADPEQLGVNFESDIARMGLPRSVDTVGEVNRKARERFGVDFRQVSLIVEGPSAAGVLERTAKLREAARAEKRVKSIRTIADLVPAPSAQEESLALARKLPLADFSARMDRAARAAGLRPEALKRSEPYRSFVSGVEGMAARIGEGRRLDVRALPDPLVAELAGFLFRAPGEGEKTFRSHSLMSLNSYKLESQDYRDLAGSLGADGKTVRMTSHVLVTYELKDSVEGDLFWVTGIVAAVVLVMLLAALRRPVFVLLALSPVVIGTACMLLVMKLSGKVMGLAGSDAVLDLNYINILAFPVLIGIGVDNAVHLIIRCRQDGLEVSGAVTETGRALVLCSLTTMFGFLSLVACPHWGIRSLGIVVAVGMAFVLLVSVFFEPAALELVARRARRAEGGESK